MRAVEPSNLRLQRTGGSRCSPRPLSVALNERDFNQPMVPSFALVGEPAARARKVQLQSLPISSPDDFEPAFKEGRGADALVVFDNSFFITHLTRIVTLAASSRLPAIYGFRAQVDVGGLMSYGADLADLYRLAATYVDKILRGVRPADLPVEQPTKFELFINRKTAKALGLTIPRELLLRADKVIE